VSAELIPSSADPKKVEEKGEAFQGPDLRERLRRVVRLRCPVCGKGKPFDGLMTIEPYCQVCGYRFQRESGYFLGSIYFNYGATAGILVIGYFSLEGLFDLTFRQQLPIWTLFSFLFPFWFHRYARSLWMALDLMVAPPSEADFVVRKEKY
jgi:uncharacterized protein (DUF983 family)